MSNSTEFKQAQDALLKLAKKRISKEIKPRMKLMEEEIKDDHPLSYKALQGAMLGKEVYDKVNDFKEGKFNEDVTLYKDRNSKLSANINRSPSGIGGGLNYQYKGDWDSLLEKYFKKDRE